jgi:hypothetical protein
VTPLLDRLPVSRKRSSAYVPLLRPNRREKNPVRGFMRTADAAAALAAHPDAAQYFHCSKFAEAGA